MRMRKGIVFGLLTFALAAWAAPARADLAISIGSASIHEGDNTGTINVLISSDVSTDSLNNFNFELQIASTNNSDQLQFIAPSTNYWVTSTKPPYIFGSDAAFDTTSTLDYVETVNGKNDTYIGTNTTRSGNSVTLTSGTSYLLATIGFDTTDTTAGDTFSVSLVQPSGNGSNAGGATTYFDTLGVDDTETSSVSYTSTPGTITILPASVPEPGSLVLGLGAITMMTGVGAVRRRRARNALVR